METFAGMRLFTEVVDSGSFSAAGRRLGMAASSVARGIGALENQLGLNQVNAVDAARAIELLNRAHSSMLFGLLRNTDFADRFAPALRRLGLYRQSRGDTAMLWLASVTRLL